MANESALHKTKTFIAAFAVDSHHGAIAGKISFRTAVDLNSQANALFVSAIPSKVDRSKLFLIIESGASRTLRYPQHIRGVNAPVFIACCRDTTPMKYQRARGCWHGVPSMIESLDLEILYQAWMAAHDISDTLRESARRDSGGPLKQKIGWLSLRCTHRS